MASALVSEITKDTVISFEINPGTLPQLLEIRTEGGPRLKCFEGSVTLVSPGRSHEAYGSRLDLMILAVSHELGLRREALRSTTWAVPVGEGDTAYEPDNAYYIQHHGRAKAGQPPDLAVEVVVSHSEKKALRAGAAIGIPELWVLDVLAHRLTFFQLAVRGKHKGQYRAQPRSRAFPVLTSAEALGRLDDFESDDFTFLENCRAWARAVLVPRQRRKNGGD